jgi:hypothetical protein
MQMANLFDHANRFDSQAMLDPAVAAWGGASFQIGAWVRRRPQICRTTPPARGKEGPRIRYAFARAQYPVCVLTEPYPLTVKAVLYRELLRSSRSADGTSKLGAQASADLQNDATGEGKRGPSHPVRFRSCTVVDLSTYCKGSPVSRATAEFQISRRDLQAIEAAAPSKRPATPTSL